MSEWRYHAMNIVTREWLFRDLPLSEVKIAPALSGPQSITATIQPEFASLKTDTGHPILDELSTFIVCEADDIIRGGGILTGSQFQGDSWQLTLTGFTTCAKGQPMTATLGYGGDSPSTGRDDSGPTNGAGADPIQIVQDLWGQLQSHPDGNLSVTFGGDTSSKYRIADWRNVPPVFDYFPDASTSISAGPVIQGTGFSKKRKAGTSSTKVPPTGKHLYWQHYVLWYEVPDIGARIDSYATSTPFDYLENVRWADPDKTNVDLQMVFGYPRLGARRGDLRFAEGENVSEIISVKRDGEDYANVVQAVGAGEGKDQLRESVTKRDGRVRRVLVVTDTSITDRTRLKNYAISVLNTVTSLTDIESITVRAHPNAPFGSYQVGDDILVSTWRAWEETSVWVRITGMSYSPDTDEVQLQTKRSDSFRYGGQSA